MVMHNNTLSDFLQLGKFRLSLLVLFTTMIGYGLGVKEPSVMSILYLLTGTLLCSMGANGLNQWWERDRDRQMARTKHRPLPAGRMLPNVALMATSCWLASGITILYLGLNPLTALLAIIISLSYLLIYTPLKIYSSIAILAGALPGAIPPVMGWTAATGSISAQAWILGCLMYLWQIPHFMSLAAIYRADYERGGYNLLPDNPAIEKTTRGIVLIFSIALLSISVLAPLAGLGQKIFAVGSLLTGCALLYLASCFYHKYSLINARRLFIGSILYLPVIMMILLLDQRIF
jgi:protoheme IX farnesyltransferase